ncbi:MAG: hypothetical protein OEZ38_10200 [Gammaproteobacteria bacterium]|nr:hypothetical protein [Gammaproteobacteria bacterium]
MQNETIQVRSTDSGQLLEVLVYSKREDQIEVMVGEGVHSLKCQLFPTSNKLAYAGNIMGREIVYERSCEQVHEDLENIKPSTRRR